MNKTGIDWCDYSWNPVTGCRNGCEFCYARKMAQRLKGRMGYQKDDPFKPTFHPDRLDEPGLVKKPSRIFAVSMGDLFSPEAEAQWLHPILKTIERNRHHTFFILTKCPERMMTNLTQVDHLPPNLFLGVSVTGPNDVWRLLILDDIKKSGNWKRFVSFEPLLGPVDNIRNYGKLDWIIVGAETGNRKNKIVPDKEWVRQIGRVADFFGIPLFMKNNIKDSNPYDKLVQEHPKSI